MKDSFDVTPFQQSCADQVQALLSAVGATGGPLLLTRGQQTAFLFARFGVKAHELVFYVYPDEAEFRLDGKWHRFEMPDFPNEPQLAAAFVESLRACLARIA